MFRLRRHRSFLQTCAFALLLLGVVSNPVLGFVGELHAVEHAALAGHPDAPGDHHHEDEGQDPGHALGTHALLHQCSGATSSLPCASPILVLAPPPALVLPAVAAPPPVRATLTLPFRPPIV